VKPRAVFLDGITFLLWTFVAFMNFGIFGILGYCWNILFGGLGVVSGLVLGLSVALKQLSSIEKNGEFKVTLKTGALMLLTIVIAIPIAVYSIFSYGLRVGILMLSFIYPCLLAMYAARIIIYLNWERKNQEFILSDWTRVYVASRNPEKSSCG
jgi:hypothetical protein